ncbi:hypothetical protein BJ742DRAFT_813060 [Cladochytrium replicatum]|nr:hypothetical protein BJ742DRAFT_813060 [Cladochytrium replicatum]
MLGVNSVDDASGKKRFSRLGILSIDSPNLARPTFPWFFLYGSSLEPAQLTQTTRRPFFFRLCTLSKRSTFLRLLHLFLIAFLLAVILHILLGKNQSQLDAERLAHGRSLLGKDAGKVVAAVGPRGRWGFLQGAKPSALVTGAELWLKWDDFKVVLSPRLQQQQRDFDRRQKPGYPSGGRSYFNEQDRPVYDRSIYTRNGATLAFSFRDRPHWHDRVPKDVQPIHSLTDEERSVAYRYLFRAWAGFAHKHRIPYWLSGDTLLGWWWGERRLPWIDALQVHFTGSTLEYLAALNGTTHGVNEALPPTPTQNILSRYIALGVWRDRYVLDVSPFAFNRLSDIHNAIEARFIDTATGLYIDLVALSKVAYATAQAQSKRLNDKYNIYLLQPLRRATFEGAETWIPASTESLLVREFGHAALNTALLGSFRFDLELLEWVRLDCTGMYEVYVKGAGQFIQKRKRLHWARNETHCVVEIEHLPRKDEEEGLTISTKEVVFGEWVQGRRRYSTY